RMTVVAIGQALDRKDAIPKVTGAAIYAAEHPVPDVVHAVTVQSTIAKGRIVSIDIRAAAQRPGVLAVLTHDNAPKLADVADGGMIGEDRLPLQDDLIHHDGQHIAVVVADTF